MRTQDPERRPWPPGRLSTPARRGAASTRARDPERRPRPPGVLTILTCAALALLLGAGLVGCGQGGDAPGPPGAGPAAPQLPTPGPDRQALALERGLLFDKGRRAVLTGWEATPEKLRASYCQGCHAEAHDQWTQGLHSAAWTDPVFSVAFKKEERLWCVHCHAPLAAQRDEYLALREAGTLHARALAAPAGAPYDAPMLIDEGINCAACHVRDGQILGARERPNDAHPVVVSDHLGSPEFCADCHQFNFPRFENGEIEYTREPMQNTYGEWLAMGGAPSCQTCHYAGTHQLRGPHDVDWMRSKFHDVSYRIEAGVLLSVRFKVSPRGHWTPSGDLFHALALEVSTSPDFAHNSVHHKWARFYERGFYEPGIFWDRVLVDNTGLRPDERDVTLTLDVPPEGPVHARLIYYYHDHHLGGGSDLPLDRLQLVLWEAQVR